MQRLAICDYINSHFFCNGNDFATYSRWNLSLTPGFSVKVNTPIIFKDLIIPEYSIAKYNLLLTTYGSLKAFVNIFLFQ